MTDIQLKLLSIYKEIRRICDKHGISFYADGGTKLGAVRHGGFIPWDDDMDLAMKLDDYKRFIKIARKELSSQYEIFNGVDLDHVDFSFIKISDRNTTFIRWEDFPFTDNYMGVHIDIFPYIGVSNDSVDRGINKKLDLIIDEITNKKLYGTGRELKVIKEDQRDLQSENNIETSKYVRNGTTSMWKYSAIFLKGGFDSSIVMKFEDTTIPVPVGYEEQLRKQYGEYMQLPPKEDRISHHFGIVDTSRPHSDYTKMFSSEISKEVTSYVHTLQIQKYMSEQRAIKIENSKIEELKHKDYFISELERKLKEQVEMTELLRQKYRTVERYSLAGLKRLIKRALGR